MIRGALRFCTVAVWLVAAADVAHGQVIVTTGLSANHTAAPGSRFSGVIELENLGDAAWTGSVGLADFQTNIGQMLFPPAGTEPRSSASWTAVEPAMLTLEPGTKGVLRYEVNVPADEHLRGSYWSVVLIQDLDTLPMSGESDVPAFQVLQLQQRAIRINTDLSDRSAFSASFVALALDVAASPPTLRVDLSNSSDRWSKVTARVELYDEAGVKVGPLSSVPRSLYPGSQVRLDVPLVGVAPGVYAALVTADAGDAGLFATRQSLRVP